MIKIDYTNYSETVKMSQDRLSNLFLIDVRFNDIVVPMVFDTGASLTVIGKSVSESIGAISLQETMTGGGNASGRISIEKYRVEMLSIGNTIIEDAHLGVITDEALDFGVDEDGKALKVYGFLGWDIIQHFRWDIDTKERTFSFEKPEKHLTDKTLHWDHMPIISVRCHDTDMHFGFDSGNTESMLNQHFMPFVENRNEAFEAITGIEGVTQESVFVLDEVNLEIGDEVINLRGISVLKRDLFPTTTFKVMGLLGSDILNHKNCIIDYFNNHFELY